MINSITLCYLLFRDLCVKGLVERNLPGCVYTPPTEFIYCSIVMYVERFKNKWSSIFLEKQRSKDLICFIVYILNMLFLVVWMLV